ncbi:MAG TPA: pilin [Candidatus Paceibacterota bacterium]|nr:pilin [Candidatus Paceibacterota bacterium]
MNRLRTIFWSALLIFVLSPRGASFAQETTSGGSGPAQPVNFPNPFKAGTSLYDFIKTIVNDILLPVGGVIIVVMTIYAGFQFVTARGNESELRKAKANFFNVVIGAAILLGAWTIATVIENTLNQLRSAV